MSRNQTAAIELTNEFPNQIVRASAGTGKTFELSSRYLRLMASGADCHSILATTFTREGAGEILDRIIARLSEAALDESAAETLSQQLEWKLSNSRAAEILLQVLRNLHRLEIGTLDSFFSRFAKAFSLELGLPATWEIVEQQQVDRLQDQAIQSILYSKNVQHLLHLMSHGQATRKVSTEVRATVQDLYETFCDAQPEAWEQIPKTGKLLNTAELEELVKMMPEAELPKHKSFEKAWLKLADLIQNDEWETVIKHGIISNFAAGDESYYKKPFTDSVREVAEQLYFHCQAVFTQRLILQNTATRDLLSRFQQVYEKLKSDTGQLRFQDVTTRLETFIESVSAEGMAFRLDNQVQHLLLDEFQDTSPAQWNVLRPFARRVTDNHDGLHSFFCVGDVKQAVFGWRGGVAEIFDLVDSELSNLSPTEPRTKSWRSSPHVIDLVNAVFANLDQYEPKDPLAKDTVHQWPDWFSEHSTARTDLDGHATVEFADEVVDEAGKVDQQESLLAATVAKIQQLDQDLASSLSIGVLVRTNREVGELIFRLQQLGIAASEEGGNPLTDSAAVEIILAALKLADAPGDSVARFRLSHSPLASHYELPLETNQNQADVADAAISVAAKIRRQLVVDGYGQTIEAMARLLVADCTAREIARLQQLVQVAYSSEAGRDIWELRPSRFVSFIRDEYKAVEPSSARVRVMTVHRSKGLEFGAVVLPFGKSSAFSSATPRVVTGRANPAAPIEVVTRYVGKEIRQLLPDRIKALFNDHKRREIREAMCVLYVAITRAVHATHVLLAPGTKPDSSTSAGVMLASLADDAVGDAIYEQGNPDWYREMEANTNLPADTSDQSLSGFYLPKGAVLNPTSIIKEVRSGRGVASHIPSGPAESSAVSIETLLSNFQQSYAAQRGSTLHRCFEQITWLDEGEPFDTATLTKHLKRIQTDPKHIRNTILAFEKAVKHPEIRELLTLAAQRQRADLVDSTDLRFEVHNEYRFAVSTDTGFQEGAIDRLILMFDKDRLIAADVIDFKSDQVEATEVSAHVQKHRNQLQNYQDAIASSLSLARKRVNTKIVFASIGKVVQLNASETLSPAKRPRKKTVSPTAQQTLWDE